MGSAFTGWASSGDIVVRVFPWEKVGVVTVVANGSPALFTGKGPIAALGVLGWDWVRRPG